MRLLSIFDIDNWREISATLSRNKTRTFLTAFGIFWGTAMLAMLHGGATGLSGTMMRNFQGFATNMGGIGASRTTMPYRGFNKGMNWSLTLDDISRVEKTSSALEFSCPAFSGFGKSTYGSKSYSGQIVAVTQDFFNVQDPVVKAGRVLNSSDIVNKEKNIVIGIEISEELFGSNPEDAIGKYLNVNNLFYRVVGVVAQRSEASVMGRTDTQIIIPVTTYSLSYHTGRNIDFYLFTAKEGHSPKEVFEDVKRVARANHPIHPDDDGAFFQFDISEMFRMVGNVFMGIDLLALFVGLGTLIAGIIGVGNIMWIIVRERTSEIGVRRAIGAKPRDIIVQIMSESMVLTTIAGTAGIVFAAMVLTVVDHLTYDENLGSAGFNLTFTGAVIIMFLFLILGTLAGLVPARRAMRIKPVEAMRGK